MINRFYLEEIPVDLGSRVEVRDLVCRWLTTGEKSRQVVTLNAAIFMNAVANPRFKQLIQKADLVTVDGYGILLALKKRGLQTERFPGVELAEQLLDYCIRKRFPVYIYGGTAAVIRELKAKFAGYDFIAMRDGFGGNSHSVAAEIIESQPRLLLVGLGSPRQEYFLAKILPQLNNTIGIGVGGSPAIIAGCKKRGPALLINHGWEWLYRMLREPRKLKLLPVLIEFWRSFLR